MVIIQILNSGKTIGFLGIYSIKLGNDLIDISL